MEKRFSGKRFDANRERLNDMDRKSKGHLSSKPLTHGGGAVAFSWLGGGVLIIAIILAIASQTGMIFWVGLGIAVQFFIVSAIIRPIEAIWTLLNERLPK